MTGLAQQPTAAHVLVKRGDGEGLYTDHPAFVAEWAVEAIALVRSHLFRASNGMVELPYEENWVADLDDDPSKILPVWVSRVYHPNNNSHISNNDEEESTSLKVTDLNLMMTEVSELLNVMEDIMALQRQRRLERMKPPGWLRRNWYVSATVGPAVLWLLWTGSIRSIVTNTVSRIRTFVHERFTERFMAIVNEILKGRKSFSDIKARQDTTQALKEMIRSWLDEMYPKMGEAERIAMSERLDMSLIERKKAESMKTFFELNNVVRVSFIEMQYMKREMMNALAAMDDVMSANDINMNLAAITPVILLVYANTRLFRFLYHAVLRLGRSREETYASFRSILTDIERLLVMRDSPPDMLSRRPQQFPPPTSLVSSEEGHVVVAPAASGSLGVCVLSSDDLGLIMLLIHELRTILMRESRRFTRDVLRGVSEDLAELAGERGAVSVRQQLQILTRMNRNYSFLKVQGTGTIFQYSLLR
uniref:Uncharacterized protein n=1 Tax=Amphora coffeiformis TaxID=265554 RepID=A0A7S3L1P6_9STRA